MRAKILLVLLLVVGLAWPAAYNITRVVPPNRAYIFMDNFNLKIYLNDSIHQPDECVNLTCNATLHYVKKITLYTQKISKDYTVCGGGNVLNLRLFTTFDYEDYSGQWRQGKPTYIKIFLNCSDDSGNYTSKEIYYGVNYFDGVLFALLAIGFSLIVAGVAALLYSTRFLLITFVLMALLLGITFVFQMYGVLSTFPVIYLLEMLWVIINIFFALSMVMYAFSQKEPIEE